ncbi:MAG: hypothetical protein Q9169_006968 [Polycauliona sp. 2 TL-2023]
MEHRSHDGLTPLLHAVHRSRVDVVSLLLDAGADIQAKTDDGFSALHLAVEAGSTEIFTILLARKIDPSLQDNYGSTPLHLACRQGLEFEVEEILKAENSSSLLDAGARIDQIATGNVLGSALMEASARGNVELVKIFLDRGAGLEVEGARFRSAAGTARAFRKYDVLKVLEDHTRSSQPRIEELAIDDAGDDE